MPMTTRMHTSDDPAAGPAELAALLHISGAGLPVGTYAYSQGLEWAVEAGWVKDAPTLMVWIAALMDLQLSRLDLPFLTRIEAAWKASDTVRVASLSADLLAWRETAELRFEDRARGQSLMRLLHGLGVAEAREWCDDPRCTFICGYALACHAWNIEASTAAIGYAFSWLEAQVIAGVKLIPLGQMQGQRVLLELRQRLPAAVALASTIDEDERGASLSGMAIASACHEEQYTRLFRS